MSFDFNSYFSKSLADITNADALCASLDTVSPTSIRLNPNKISHELPLEKVAWSDYGYYLPKRPVFTLDPLFHAGAYYVQEASSMFLEKIVTPLAIRPLKVLDLCSAPGGKSTHIISLLPRGSVLVANEVIRSRAYIVSENLIKWGKSNCVVTNNDPKDFDFLPGFFDIIIVDAPCSGEGMFRKDPKSRDEWSPDNVDLCSKRQTRILHDIWDALAPGGTLIYSTCTYNEKENEDVLSAFMKETDAVCKKVPLDTTTNIIEHEKQGVTMYRFFPHTTKGEGFSIGVLQKQDGKLYVPPKRASQTKRIKILTDKSHMNYTNLIVNHNSIMFERQPNVIWSFSAEYRKFLLDVYANCNVIHAGIPLVEIQGHKLNPLPGLAFANSFNKQILPAIDIDLQTAAQYFKKHPLVLESGIGKGWVQLMYKGISVGFVKNIGNRANNPYPSEWAIRMNFKPEDVWSIVE